MTIRGSCGNTFRGLIKGTSRDLCPISVDDDLAHPVSLDVISSSLASLIALEGAIGKCGRVGGRVRVYSLNKASAVDFDSSEPGGICFPARGARWASECDGNGESEELLGTSFNYWAPYHDTVPSSYMQPSMRSRLDRLQREKQSSSEKYNM
jgi:hypothetical protein